MTAKQVLVMRKFAKDRNLRTGKYVAQGAHASMGALFSIASIDLDKKHLTIPLDNPFVYEWVTGAFTKIVVYVDDEYDLEVLHNKAKLAGIATSLIRDSGLTEFNGVPTLTAVGIGPDSSVRIDEITKHLPLF